MNQYPQLDNREVKKVGDIEQKTGVNPLIPKNINYTLFLKALKGMAILRKDYDMIKKLDILLNIDELKGFHNLSKRMDTEQVIDVMKVENKGEVDFKKFVKENFGK